MASFITDQLTDNSFSRFRGLKFGPVGSHYKKMAPFGFSSTSTDVMAGVSLVGKFALVTGGTGGLGEETARALCEAGAHVTIMGRDAAKAKAAVSRIRARHPAATIDVALADLAELASIKRMGEQWAGRPLDLLFLNAGVMAMPLTRTAEGWEMQFATNHFGHFLLTALLAPSLRSGARVVVTSSAAHEFAPVDLGDVHFLNRPYSPWQAYGQSKTANVLFAAELDKRLRPRVRRRRENKWGTHQCRVGYYGGPL